MKRLLYVLVCMLIMCACNNNGAPSLPSPDSTEEDAQPDSSTKDSDSISGNKRDRQGVSNRLGIIEVEINDLKGSISDMQARMSNDSTQIVETMNQKVDRKVDASAFFAAIFGLVILLILIIVLFAKNNKLRREINAAQSKEENDIENINLKLNNLQSSNTRQYKPLLSKGDIDNLNRILNDHNTRLAALEAKEQSRKESHNGQGGHSASPKVERNIYFGVNQGNIFTMELSASDERVAFKGNKISEDKVEFIPISWDRIKSLNSLDAVVKIKGSLKDSNMKVLSKGYAVKRVENGKSYWQVMDPVEIQLV